MLAFNPYLPACVYIPDGEPHVFGDRLYVYGSHDCFGGHGFCELDYECWSAPIDDLGNWRCDGTIYRKDQDPDNVDGSHAMFAPDVCQGPDGKYYLYYGLDFTAVIGVARADRPEGPFEFYGNVRDADGNAIGSRAGDALQYDPGILVDDDGKIYLYSGFCTDKKNWKALNLPEPPVKGAMVMELLPDMLTIREEPKTVLPWKKTADGTSFKGHAFFEASSVRKVRDEYYYIYSSENSHELCYARSKKPDQGFVFGGTIISNGDIFEKKDGCSEPLNYTGTNHGSIVEVNGKWYVFYHRQTNKSFHTRQGCAEQIFFDEQGNIRQVSMTSCGLNDGPLPAAGTWEAYIACNLMSCEGATAYSLQEEVSDIHPYITQCNDETAAFQYIANMREGACAGYKFFSFSGKESVFTLTYRSKSGGRMDVGTSLRGCEIAHLDMESSQDWTTAAAKINISPGICGIYLTFHGEAADIKSFEIRL